MCQVETFSVSKNFDTFPRTPVRVSKMNVNFTSKIFFCMIQTDWHLRGITTIIPKVMKYRYTLYVLPCSFQHIWSASEVHDDVIITSCVCWAITVCCRPILPILFRVTTLVSGQSVDRLTLSTSETHYDVIKWKHFPRNWPFCAGN